MNGSDKLWRQVQQNDVISRILQKLQPVRKNSYFAVTDYVLLNWQNDEWELCSMKVSASRVCKESNHTKITFIWKRKLLLPCCYQLCPIAPTKNEWEWCSMKVSAPKICHELIHTKIEFNKKYKCSYLAVPDDVWYNWQNNKTYDLQYTNSNNNNR